MELKTIEELKNAIVLSKKKVMFERKIEVTLKFCKMNQNVSDQIGIRWYDEPNSILLNPFILGAFLGVKPNSINKNLISLGFQLSRGENKEFHESNEKIVDKKRWSVRRKSAPQIFQPRNDITDDEINGLVLMHRNKSSIWINFNIFTIMLNQTNEWKQRFQRRVKSEWTLAFGAKIEAPYEHVIQHILMQKSDSVDMIPFIKELLVSMVDDSRDLCGIDQYYRFCSYFGFRGSSIVHIRELNSANFCISFGWKSSKALLETFEVDPYVISMSSVPGEFFVQARHNALLILNHVVSYNAINNEYSFKDCTGNSILSLVLRNINNSCSSICEQEKKSNCFMDEETNSFMFDDIETFYEDCKKEEELDCDEGEFLGQCSF